MVENLQDIAMDGTSRANTIIQLTATVYDISKFPT